MTEAKLLGDLIAEGIQAVAQLEIDTPGYMDFEQFKGHEFPNYARASKMIDEAADKAKRILGLACAKDRRDRKEEDSAAEITMLTTSLTPEEVAISDEIEAWWHA